MILKRRKGEIGDVSQGLITEARCIPLGLLDLIEGCQEPGKVF